MNSNKELQVGGLTFVPFITEDMISARVAELSAEIEKEYEGSNPLYVVILNGSFMFASDFLRQLSGAVDTQFVRLASYNNTESTGKVRQIIGLADTEIEGREIVVIEDIVDTGTTMHHLVPDLFNKGAESVELCSLLFKPDKLQFTDATPKYAGFVIPNEFVLGYGLDYNGAGRNLKEIYKLKS